MNKSVSPNVEKRQFARQIRQIARFVSEGEYDVKDVVGTLVVIWSKRQAPGLSCSGFRYLRSLDRSKEIQSFVEWLCCRDFLEAAYWLSSAYSIWTGQEYRKKLAMFFTPPSLTRRLLDDLEQFGASFLKHSFFDPACGGAAFLAPIALRMKSELKAKGKSDEHILRHVEQHLFGTDLDPVLCQMSNQFLRIALADEIVQARIEPNFHVTKANSLSDVASLYGSFDVLVCNPPYRKMAAEEVAVYREDYDTVIEAQPNLYGLFMTLGLRLLRPTGVAAFVTPTSFLSGQYFSKLRTHLMENAEIVNIGIVRDRSGVFIDVDQETALTILKRRAPKYATETTANVSVVSRHGDLTSVGRCVIPNSGSAWPIPRTEGDAELIQLIGKSKYRLSDYGYRPRTGVFVWNRDKRPTFHSWKEAKAASAVAPFPLFWSSDIRPGGVVAFDGAPKSNFEPCFVDVLTNSSVSILRRPSVLLQRVTSNDQQLRLVAGVVPTEVFCRFGGFIGENHVVALESQADIPAFSPEVLVAVLGSQPVDRYFRCISGATNVSIFELQLLPLPDPKRLCALLKIGLAINEAVIQAYR
ncbi:HsdM family class I SAM-dependent methyltransferase [Collimonas fungivorans]|uniref:HsdM family class I SAM-dependent methyltransferase n=1 Tax=Collimonas fungivorans TaxID=158899 RepID=UPI003FA36C3C